MSARDHELEQLRRGIERARLERDQLGADVERLRRNLETLLAYARETVREGSAYPATLPSAMNRAQAAIDLAKLHQAPTRGAGVGKPLAGPCAATKSRNW